MEASNSGVTSAFIFTRTRPSVSSTAPDRSLGAPATAAFAVALSVAAWRKEESILRCAGVSDAFSCAKAAICALSRARASAESVAGGVAAGF